MTFSKFVTSWALLIVSLWISACSDTQDQQDKQTTVPQAEELLTVYKSPTCGCCAEWVDHVESASYATETNHPENLEAIKDHYKVPGNLRSCHTAVSKKGYVFEGHVPARYIKQFLDNPPKDAIGLTVPGMPVGSPGMEVGDKFSPYKVILLKQDGTIQTFASVDGPSQQ